MKVKVLVHAAEKGGYWAEVPALPGCVSEGETFDKVIASIREAAEGWIEVASRDRPGSDQEFWAFLASSPRGRGRQKRTSLIY
jgi:predicted RNase H-like HicB family nuclease